MAAILSLAAPVTDTLFADLMGALSPSDDHAAAGAAATARERLMSDILEVRPTAPIAWLSRFSDDALHDYLLRLQSAAAPRGRAARWVRTGDLSAVTVADAPE